MVSSTSHTLVSYQLSVTSYQLTVISYQLSVISYQGGQEIASSIHCSLFTDDCSLMGVSQYL
ncbi:hypothetical protein DP113_10075 [Brasilonema octagenarum UFV-E1]|uniref:Uncharacterized protein n=1 Tax=Brasilonema sennae CENA114 TaxID=415709 RepID=A0A856MC01_9CYAN|nr:hypothetical protein DP114_10130 [Brasilonema sennae CENA114]QDL14568.1 hypothetical protein DP113_10075 [Brasilonema octagenarum UFV-E1]